MSVDGGVRPNVTSDGFGKRDWPGSSLVEHTLPVAHQ